MRNDMNSLRVFQDSVAIVTGAASGIGRGLAEELARRGSEVVIADRNTDLANQVAAGIRDAGGKASAAELDVRDAETVTQLVTSVVDRTGRLDFMFNNAGIGVLGETHQHSLEDWNYIVDVNLRGVIHGIHAAYPVMIEQGFGHIVNTASIAGLTPVSFLTSYVATKYAVVGLSQSLRAEAAPLGVRVSVLCPGAVRTAILDEGTYTRLLVPIPPDFMERAKKSRLLMDPNAFAKRVLRAVARNQGLIIVPFWARFFPLMNRLSPSLGVLVARLQYRHAQTVFREER